MGHEQGASTNGQARARRRALRALRATLRAAHLPRAQLPSHQQQNLVGSWVGRMGLPEKVILGRAPKKGKKGNAFTRTFLNVGAVQNERG